MHLHSPKVSNDIDDEEDGALCRLEGEIGPVFITRHRMLLSCRNEPVVDHAGRSQLGACRVSSEGEDQDDDDKDTGVEIVRKERSLDSAEHSVEDDANGKDEAGCRGWNSGQGLDNGRAACEKLCAHQDVCHQAEDDVHQVGDCAVSGSNDFHEGMGVGGLPLELNRKRSEKNDLYCGSGGIPERPADSISKGDGR